ncbi:MAG: GFA family protein [Parvularcula sp.]
MAGELITVSGQCHCGTVRWEADVPARVEIHECNCSMCNKVGFQHLIVPKSRFRLLAGEDKLTRYSFNTGVAQHLFCSVCGVKGFYVPRSNPDGISLNFRCLDQSVFEEIEIVPFDGQNWEQNAGSLASLSID